MQNAFDEQALMQRVDGDIEFLEETVEMLDEDGPELLSKINEAAASGNAEAIVSPAHTLKVMLSDFCAEKAEQAALQVETMGRQQQMDGITTFADTLSQETDKLREALHAFLEANKS